MQRFQFFLSYSSEDSFEALLLKEAIERMLRPDEVRVWAFGSDQPGDERSVGASLKQRIQESAGLIMLLSRFTLESGAAQWMELAYADAFGVPAFIILHHLTFDELTKADRRAPPLVLEGQCTLAANWRSLENGLRACCVRKRKIESQRKARATNEP